MEEEDNDELAIGVALVVDGASQPVPLKAGLPKLLHYVVDPGARRVAKVVDVADDPIELVKESPGLALDVVTRGPRGGIM